MKVFGFGFLVKGEKERETLEKVGKRQEAMKSGVLCVIIREKYWGYSRNVLIIFFFFLNGYKKCPNHR